MQKSVLILKHAPWEGPGLILDALHEWGIRYDIRSIADEAAPLLCRTWPSWRASS